MSTSNRFYTILIVPEKTSQVRRLIVPSWLLKGAAVAFALVSLIGIVMFLDYWYVMNQISENKQLRMENRRLRQQVQVFKNKMATVDNTMDRIKSFTTKLKEITDIRDKGDLIQSLNRQLPKANENLGVATTGTSAGIFASVSGAGSLGSIVVDPEAINDPEDAALRKEYEVIDEQFAELNRE